MVTVLQIVLIVSVISSITFIIFVYFDIDRTIKSNFSTIRSLSDEYNSKPKPSTVRSVILIKCKSALCESTLKCLLDQSVGVHDISVETDFPELLSNDIKRIVTVHKYGTAPIREVESSTIVIDIPNGSECYPYDFIEMELRKKGVTNFSIITKKN